MLKYCFFLVCFLYRANTAIRAQDLVINEIQSSNMNTIYDHTGDTPDWIEIYNGGLSLVNLENYGLSDVDSLPLKWTFPSTVLPPQSRLLVFASGLNLKDPSLHWETVVDLGDEWKYFVPVSELADTWKNTGFDDTNWLTGKSGFGYGDGDDSTVIEATMSIFIRKRIIITNKNDIEQAYLHIDFDDAFVAYLNGVEIARSNIGKQGISPVFDQAANNYDHEAAMYQGGLPDEFLIDSVYDYLNEGENILAIQIHNYNLSSSDLTAIPIFTIGRISNPGYSTNISPYINLRPIGLHTNFKISSNGENIILSDPFGQQIDSIYTSKIPADISLGRKPDGNTSWVFFNVPTPGLSNVTKGYSPTPVAEVQYSKRGGLYQNSIDLQLSTTNPSDSLFFTTDGSEPDKNDSLYSSALNLSKTTAIRARVIQSGYLPGKIATHIYLINEPHDLPIVSVNTDPYNLWDEDYGIYILGKNASSEKPFYGANFWEDWERPANIAMYEQDGTLAFQLDAGIKIFGSYSRRLAQKSLSIHSRKSYGYDGINYKIFDEKEIGKFKTIILRNSGNDFNGTMLRDAYANRVISPLELDHQAYRPAVVYINGKYWGIQNIREKVNEEFISSNHGIEEDLIDILEFNGGVVKGNAEHYESLLLYLNTNNLSSEENYKYVSDRIDVENYIKYQVANIFIDNQDWPGNNIKYWRERSPQGKWRWIVFDLDAAFSAWFEDNKSFNTLKYALAPNGPKWPNPPWATFLFRKLMENKSFKYDFINAFADNLNTIFKPSVLEKILNEMKSVIEPEISNHLNRWGGGSIEDWENRISKIRNFVKERQRYVRGHIRKEFSLSGTYNINVKIENEGHIQLNTITLNNFPWNGLYFNDVPVKIEAIPKPGYKFVEWEGVETTDREHLTLNTDSSTVLTAIFGPYEEVPNQVIINEINYNSNNDFDPGDWVELLNISDYAINVSGWVIKDGKDDNSFVLPAGTIIDSHGFIVICRNQEKFSALFPSVELVDGEMDFGFSSGGECIRLFTSNNLLMDKVCYETDDPWPAEPNGNGQSLALIDALSNNEHPANWKSSIYQGTPGAKNKDIITGIIDSELYVESMSVKVYPNPINRIANIEIISQTQGELSMSLIDITGRRIGMPGKAGMAQVFSLSLGKNKILLNFDEIDKGLTSGVYILLLETKDMKRQVKILVQD